MLEGKKWIYIYIYIYIFKAKEREQYQNNGTEDLFIVIMYLIEAFKIRLLLIAGSFESRKRSNSTFKWLGKFLKDEVMLDMSIRGTFKHFRNWGSAGKNVYCLQHPNCSYIRGSRYLESHA